MWPIGKLHFNFLQCQNMINRSPNKSLNHWTYCAHFWNSLTFSLTMQNSHAKNEKHSGWHFGYSFFALLNNSLRCALRTVPCTTEEYWKGLLTKAPTLTDVAVFSCCCAHFYVSTLQLQLLSQIALLWTSLLKLLCKTSSALSIFDKKVAKVGILLFPIYFMVLVAVSDNVRIYNNMPIFDPYFVTKWLFFQVFQGHFSGFSI